MLDRLGYTIKVAFLDTLETEWRRKREEGETKIDREELIEGAMRILERMGDKNITREDIEKVINKVWGKEQQ